jgi:hypothetical protein
MLWIVCLISFGSAWPDGSVEARAASTLTAANTAVAETVEPTLLVQVPYEPPPKQPSAAPPVESTIPPANRPLTPEEIQRAEALLALLDGKQEFWAMGEFVHLGPPAVPVLIKALKLPSARLRYNAIETMLMIKDRGAVPALLETAQLAIEIPRIREHALRVAVRLDSPQVSQAIEVMAKDPNSSVRKAAAFEARYVRQKAVIPVLISLLPDDERFVAISAIQSLWVVTRHDSEMHDWDNSSRDERREWAEEWVEWWSQNQETFQVPEPRRPSKPLS